MLLQSCCWQVSWLEDTSILSLKIALYPSALSISRGVSGARCSSQPLGEKRGICHSDFLLCFYDSSLTHLLDWTQAVCSCFLNPAPLLTPDFKDHLFFRINYSKFTCSLHCLAENFNMGKCSVCTGFRL